MKGKTKFEISENQKEYIVALKKQSLLWLLLLLLLLPLLLLIPFRKNINIQSIDKKTQSPVAKANVYLQYIDYQLYNFHTKRFFTHDSIELYCQSDSTGIANYKNIKYTLYSLIFHSNKKAKIIASTKCLYGDSSRIFRKLNKKIFKLNLKDRFYPYTFFIQDKENHQPIAGAKVFARIQTKGKIYIYEGITQPDGSIYFGKFPYCGKYIIAASANAYITDSITGDAHYLYDNDSLKKIKLTPQKQSIHFFVKDLKTKQAIANAEAKLIINGQVVQSVRTNSNGYAVSPGEGVFTNVAVNKNFTIQASKEFYHDTTKSDNVKHWVNLSDSSKILYLRPLYNSLTFRDISNNLGLAGVKNIIYINGKAQPNAVYSNNNGYFTVSGLNPNDKIKIVASKPGYNTNDYTINNQKFADLIKSPQNRRNIPLTKPQVPTPPPPKEIPHSTNDNNTPTPPPGTKVYPCEAPQEAGGQGITTNVHSIGNSIKFTINWDMYNVPDQIIIYCGTGSNKKRIFSTNGPVSGKGSATLFCKKHFITVKIIGQQQGTQWSYRMNCE